MKWIDEANQDQVKLGETISFEEYYEEFKKNPREECRPTCMYLMDMLDHFEKGEEDLFDRPHVDAPAVYGQHLVEMKLKKNLKNFSEEGFNNKFLLLTGPNGSSKSSIVKKIMSGAEDYSKSENGKLYTFSWIFPIESYVKGTLSLTSSNAQHNLKSYASLDDKDINAIINSELKDHPLLLIPLEHRRGLIDDFFADDPAFLDTVRKSYLYNGDLSKRNRMIYDALMKSYKGDHAEVLKHIRVERFFISKRFSNSAVTIEPQVHQDARLQQITMDRRLERLPPSLQSLNLFQMQGEAVLANRGILEFSDLLKRPIEAFKYLLTTMETKCINIGGILTELDIFFIGSSNEVHLAAFKQHPDFNSFKGRFTFIKVPYLLDFQQEKRIYNDQIQNIKDRIHFEPEAIEALCLFAVMTRIRPSLEKNYKDKTVGKLAASLSPIEKTLFLSLKRVPERLKRDEMQALLAAHYDILTEFENENLYEGKFGISPRSMKQIIYELSFLDKTCSFMEVLEFLTEFTEKKNEHDFLNISPQGEYHNPIRFIESIKGYMLERFDDVVRDSLGMIDKRSYEEYIEKYVAHINAHIKNEKIRNTVTSKFEDCDMYFIKEVEKNLVIKENIDEFRSHLISKLGAFYLDNPGKDIIYMDVFPRIVKDLRTSFKEEQKKKIQAISENLMYYKQYREEPEKYADQLKEYSKQEIENLLKSLQEKHGYSQMGSVTLLEYLIKNSY